MKEQINAALMMTSANFGLHFMLANVSDDVWEPLSALLAGEFNPGRNPDGTYLAGTTIHSEPDQNEEHS